MRQVQTVVDALLRSKARRATKFMSPTLVVRATRIRYRGRFNDHHLEFRLTIGRPNHAEKKFIKACKRAGEPFPVRKIKLGMLATPKPKQRHRATGPAAAKRR